MFSATSRSIESLTNLDARLAWIVWGVVASIALIILLLIVGAPVAAAQGHSQLAAATYKTFSFLCHQIPERSFHLGSHQFAVCSRCTGLYAGFAVATLAFPLVCPLNRTDAPRVVWLLLSAVPLAIDFSLTYFSVWQNTHLTRFTTGTLFGSVAAIYVLPGVIDLITKVSRYLRKA